MFVFGFFVLPPARRGILWFCHVGLVKNVTERKAYQNMRHKKDSPSARVLLSTLLALFLSLAAAAAAVALPIVNELTKKHVLIPDTGVYFVPASGMTLSKEFDGFSSEARGIEVIVANIKEPYATICESFTDDALKSRGIEVKSRGSLTVNGAEGTLLKALHTDGGRKWAKWILLLDCGGRTLVVNGVFPGGNNVASRDVEAMLKSVFVNRMEAGV